MYHNTHWKQGITTGNRKLSAVRIFLILITPWTLNVFLHILNNLRISITSVNTQEYLLDLFSVKLTPATILISRPFHALVTANKIQNYYNVVSCIYWFWIDCHASGNTKLKDITFHCRCNKEIHTDVYCGIFQLLHNAILYWSLVFFWLG